MDQINFITLSIIVITSVFSFIGFSNQEIFDRFMFSVDGILHRKEWDRMLTSALLHGDTMHLLFNMMTLFFFADVVIAYVGKFNFLLIYLASILCGNFLSLWMHRKNSYYTAIGASGGVVGIVFASIALAPSSIYIYGVLPGWLFGIGYLAFSIYAMRGQRGNIGHEAHLGGAVIGMILAIVFYPYSLQVNAIYIAIMSIPVFVLGYYVYKDKG